MAAVHQRLSVLDLNERILCYFCMASDKPLLLTAKSDKPLLLSCQRPTLSQVPLTLQHHAAASTAQDCKRGGRRLQQQSQSDEEELGSSRGRQEVEEDLSKTVVIRFPPEIITNC